MSLSSRNTKLYQQDVVQKLSPPHSIGIVLRCWHDAEEVHLHFEDPLMRPLERGEVGVSFLSEAIDKREILPESQLKLLDRSLQAGDFCKRSVDDIQSGVILDSRMKCRLEHVISKEPVDRWITHEELDTDRQAEIGDYVVYDDWVGQVIELYDENIVEVPSGQLVRLPEFGSRLSVGEKSENILPSPAGGVQNMLGFLFGSNRTAGMQTVIAVKHTIYVIAWLALNQTLDHSLTENRERPQRFWHGPDIGKLTLVRNRLDFQLRIGERVKLKNKLDSPFTTHGREGEAGGVVIVDSYIVTATASEVHVLWQDGSTETLRSVDVIPYLNPDEYDCWPGDHVFFIADGNPKHVVIQTVDAAQRTASVLLESGSIEQVSLLELDLQGASDSVLYPNSEGLGLSRGEVVLCSDKSNGFEIPRVPRIGELEAWVHVRPSVHSGQLDGWRGDLATLGADIATRRGFESIEEGSMKSMPDVGTILWLGEVINLRLDGMIEVLHPEGTLATYPLERLIRLHDGMEQLEEFFEEGSEDDHHMHGIWDFGHHLHWHDDEDDGDENQNEDMMDLAAEDIHDYRSPMSPSPSISPENTPTSSTSPLQSDPPVPGGSSQPLEPDIEASKFPQEIDDKKDDNWTNFKLLSSTPLDHAYYSTTPVQPSRQFMSRMNKEYRILMTSLPESILVRAFEDRADLLRSLIIGPENTPYENAPFVIDWHLVDYPHTAPVAHFHSLTNGNGRVNPNLYEEGKVCLSILNTWTGDRSESWDASRSSLLQALVSIQGLVLVREPWFCEPAYEKLRGTEEGIVNSRLYSEKAYVLSRGFVRRTLETPFGGLEPEIDWIYYSNHLLEKLLNDSQALISRSREQLSDEVWEESAVPKLTAGGIIALERTLVALQSLLQSRNLKAA